MQTVEIKEADFKNKVLQSKVPVLVDFYATWCGPCKAMGEILEEVAADVKNKAAIVKVDVDESKELSGKYNIMSVPTLILFEDGKIKKEMIGVQTKENLINILSTPS